MVSWHWHLRLPHGIESSRSLKSKIFFRFSALHRKWKKLSEGATNSARLNQVSLNYRKWGRHSFFKAWAKEAYGSGLGLGVRGVIRLLEDTFARRRPLITKSIGWPILPTTWSSHCLWMHVWSRNNWALRGWKDATPLLILSDHDCCLICFCCFACKLAVPIKFLSKDTKIQRKEARR